MTTVDLLFRYAVPPTDVVALGLVGISDVYGIRGIKFDHAVRTLRVEYDATRLNAATVTKLVRQAGLEIAAVLPMIPPPSPVPEPAPRA